jgi:hypothetical protein
MKRLLTLLLILLPLALFAQSEREALLADYKANVHRTCANTAPYEFIPGPQTRVPKGYKPFYISHYGRHGSRNNWNNKYRNYEQLSGWYHKADSAGILTAEGKAAMQLVDSVIVLHAGMDGRLTPLGAQEHRQIAHRMYVNNKNVFRKGSKKIVARSSIVPRVLVSMAAFTGELLSLQKDLDVSWDSGERLMSILSSDHTREMSSRTNAWKKEWGKQHTYGTEAFLKRIFTDPEAGRAIVDNNPERLMRRNYEVASVCPAFGLDDRLFDLFEWPDLLFFGEGKNISLYMNECNSVEMGDERMPGTDSLIRDIIERADAAIATGAVAADLRFGHDFQLLAASARLGLSGVAERRTFEESVDWPAWRYSPFAGNFQLIFYKNKKGEVLVKPLLNERETVIVGLEGFPYYKWEEVRALWSRSL